jgi:hypothetical protein
MHTKEIVSQILENKGKIHNTGSHIQMLEVTVKLPVRSAQYSN